MPKIPFLAGADGNPTKLVSWVKGQPTEDVLPIAAADPTFRQFRDYGGGPTLNQNYINALAFSSTGEPLDRLPGKLAFAAGDKSLGDFDPNDYGAIHMLANLFGGRVAFTNPGAGGIHQQQFDSGQTVDANLARLAFLHRTNVLPPHIVWNARVGAWTLQASPNDNLRHAFTLGAGQFLLAGDPEDETVVGTPTPPLIEGFWPASLTEDDLDLWIKVTATDATTVTFQAALGAEAVEPTWSTSQVATKGTPIKARDSVDQTWIGGSYGAAVKILFPSGGTYEANSVQRYSRHRTIPSETLGASRAIASIDSVAFIDDEPMRLTGGWELNVAWETFEVTPGVSDLQGHFVDVRGQLITTFAPSRRIESLTLQSAILRRSKVSVVIKAETETFISGEVEPYQLVVVIPRMTIGGDVYTPGEGSDTAEENPTFQAGVPLTTFTHTDERGNDFATAKAISIFLRNDRSAA